MHRKFFLLFATVLFVSFLYAQNNVTFSKGKKAIRTSTLQTKTITDIMGQSMEQNQTMALKGEIVIADVSEKEIKIEEKITKFKMSMKVMGQETEYDSDKTNNNEEFNKLKDFLNKPTFITTDFLGLVTDFKYTSEVEEEMKKLVGAGFNSNYNIGQPIDFILVLPKDAAVGKSWTLSFTIDSIKTNYAYTIKSIENSIAKVELTGNTGINKKTEMNGNEIEMSLTGTVAATFLVDVKTNWVKTSTTTTSQKGSIDMMGQSVPMEILVIKEDTFE